MDAGWCYNIATFTLYIKVAGQQLLSRYLFNSEIDLVTTSCLYYRCKFNYALAKTLCYLLQKFLPQYVAMFEWLYNLEKVTVKFLQMLLVPDFTFSSNSSILREEHSSPKIVA